MSREIIWSPNTIFDGVELIDNENEHRYLLGGHPVPGCTSLIEKVGLSDYSGIPKAVMDNASRFGTKTHSFCEWLDQDDLDLESLKQYDEYYWAVYGWQQFKVDNEFVPIVIEKPMVIAAAGMRFGVKPDRFGFCGMDERAVVVEIKTTSSIEYSAYIQTAAQALAIKTVDNPIPRRIIVQLLDKPNAAGRFYNAVEPKNPVDEKVFVASLLIHYCKQNHGIK